MVKMGYLKTMYWVTAWEFKNVSQTYLFITTAGKYSNTKNNIVKRKKEDKQKPLRSYLQKLLEKQNLKMVDVRRDRNWLFRAIAHQLCYNQCYHKRVRQFTVKEVIENPERYKNFVTDGLDE